jgi:urea transporter
VSSSNQSIIPLWLHSALASLVFIYIFYTIPITAAQKVVEPANLRTTLPAMFAFFNSTAFLSVDLVSGLISGLLYTAFFALCPVMFKMIANAGSRATSVQEAEKYALHYYWYFMLTTAFVFTVSIVLLVPYFFLLRTEKMKAQLFIILKVLDRRSN